MRNEEEKLRFNTFIYATLAIHWTLCHRYLVFRGWFNSRILSIVHRLHVDSVFFSLSRLVTLNKNECAWKPNSSPATELYGAGQMEWTRCERSRAGREKKKKRVKRCLNDHFSLCDTHGLSLFEHFSHFPLLNSVSCSLRLFSISVSVLNEKKKIVFKLAESKACDKKSDRIKYMKKKKHCRVHRWCAACTLMLMIDSMSLVRSCRSERSKFTLHKVAQCTVCCLGNSTETLQNHFVIKHRFIFTALLSLSLYLSIPLFLSPCFGFLMCAHFPIYHSARDPQSIWENSTKINE